MATRARVQVTLDAGETLSQIISALNSFRSATAAWISSPPAPTGKLKISTTGYGSAETVGVTPIRTRRRAGQLGFGTIMQTDTGVDVAGTGQRLRGDRIGSNADGPTRGDAKGLNDHHGQ